MTGRPAAPIIAAMLPRTFQIASFGCKVNQAEGQSLAAGLRAAGLVEAPQGAAAGLIIVNTCAVTGEAARQARQFVRHALRAGAAVAVTGCAAHPAAGDAALRAIPGVLLIEPDKEQVVAWLRQCRVKSAECRVKEETAAGGNASNSSLFTLHSSLGRARALLKIQDGCPASCAYCIVPKVRPTVQSLSLDEAASQVERLVAAGYGEIVLCGIHLGLYGVPAQAGKLHAECGVRSEEGRAPAGGLVDLLDRCIAMPGRFRVRLSSIEPMEVTDALLERMAARPDRQGDAVASPDRLCPHLHLPLQSGSDAVLERMRRPYRSAEFLATVERVRRALAQPAITSDVLVGFPGETDADHAETLRVCRAAHFSRIHVFPFSKRPGTAAALMGPEVPAEVIRRRRCEVAGLGEELARAYRESLVGTAADVVIERVSADGSAEGYCERYVVVRVRALLPGAARREIVGVTLTGVCGDVLEGEAVL